MTETFSFDLTEFGSSERLMTDKHGSFASPSSASYGRGRTSLHGADPVSPVEGSFSG